MDHIARYAPRPDIAMSNDDRMLDEIIARTGNLYSLPAVAMRVLELTEDPHVDTRILKECIEKDPALTSKILRVVNSALFGFSKEIASLNQALALLGAKPLELLVLGFSLPEGLTNGVSAEALGRYWQRALTRAVAARHLAQHVYKTSSDESFVAALLADVGRLVLLQQLGDPYAQFLDSIKDSPVNPSALERKSLGFDHARLSARLLAHWKLPEVLCRAVAVVGASSHTSEQIADLTPLATAVAAADQLTDVLIDGQHAALAQFKTFLAAARGKPSSDIADEDVDQIVEPLQNEVALLAGTLGVSIPDDADFSHALAAAQRKMTSVGESVAQSLLRNRHQLDEKNKSPHTQQQLDALARARDSFQASSRPPSRQPADTKPTPPQSNTDSTQTATVTKTRSGHLQAHVSQAVAAARHARCPVSLMFVEIDDAHQLAFVHGPQHATALLQRVARAAAEIDHEHRVCVQCDDARWAVILVDCDRQLAVRLGNQLLDELADSAPPRDSEPSAESSPADFSVSVGIASVAVVARNFPVENLVDAASRCLYASHVAGGRTVKSIEIY